MNSPVSTGWFQDVGTKDMRRQVVDLVGFRLLEGLDQGELVEKVGLHQFDPVLEMTDALEGLGARTPDHAGHLVAFFKQEVGQVGAILTCDAGNQRFHKESPVVSGSCARSSRADHTSRR